MTSRNRLSRFISATALASIMMSLLVAANTNAAPQVFSMMGEMRVNTPLSLPLPPPVPGADGPGIDIVGSTYYLGTHQVGACVDCITQNTGVPDPTMTIPAGLFSAPQPVPFNGFPLPNPALIQITTMFRLTAPAAASGSAVLSGRSGPATFSWCPGPGTACTTPTQATLPGLPFVTYTSGGGNQFGGSMQVFISSTAAPSGTLVRRVNNSPVRGEFIPIAGGGNNHGPGGNFTSRTLTLGSAATHNVHTITNQTPAGFILGFVPTPFSTVMSAGARRNWAFPWTTGMITLSATNPPNPANRLFTLTGSDTRGSDGEGRLSLVAGGMTFTNTGTWALETAEMNVTTFTPEPGTFLAAGVALLAIGGGRLLARRKS